MNVKRARVVSLLAIALPLGLLLLLQGKGGAWLQGASLLAICVPAWAYGKVKPEA